MKIVCTKIDYITLLKAVFNELDLTDLNYEKLKDFDSLLGISSFPSDDHKEHLQNNSLKAEVLKNNKVVHFLCNQSERGKGWLEWCSKNGRKVDSDQFFPYNTSVNINEYEHLLDLNCVKSKVHLECIFKTFNAKIYYDYYKYFQDFPTKSKKLNFKYITVLTVFLGYTSFKEFKESPLFSQLSQSNDSVVDLSHNSIRENRYTEFIGYYYDYLKNNVFSFLLKIDFNSNKHQSVMNLDDPNAKQIGLHRDHDNLEYEGNAYFLNHKMHIILWYLNTDHGAKEKIKIILNSGHEKFEKARVLKGLILASNSINNSPISIESIFTRKDFKYSEDEEVRIQRYLMIKRNNIIVRNKSFDFKKLSTKNLVVDRISRLQGTWHSIRYDKNWKLVHSIVHVERNYRITCYSYVLQTITIQKCYFDPSDKSDFVIYISSKEDNAISSQIAIKLPKRNSSIIKGVMILQPGNDDDDFHPIMRAIVLGRIDSEILLNDDCYDDENIYKVTDFLTQFSDFNKDTRNPYSKNYEKLNSALDEINSTNKVNV